jgi:Family of unknown function (DUF6515)
MRAIAFGLSVVLVVALPLTAGAQRRGGGGGRPAGGGFSRPAPSRPAGGGGGGFNFNRDARPSQPVNRPPANNGNANRPNNNFNNNNHNNFNNNNVNHVNNNNVNVNRNNNVNINNNNNVHVNNNNNYNRNYYNNGVHYNGAVVVNPVYRGSAWGWNHGVAWYPAPTYWGGGFWGAMAIGATSAAVFGSLVNSTNHQSYTSYQVQPSSPGATLLSNYGLTQTQCGGPNLVNIYGPNNSAICAYPNNTVSAGNYSVNASNLTIVSA